ncbi:MAG: M15 family metallopeptidase [Bacteroidota bacterium]
MYHLHRSSSLRTVFPGFLLILSIGLISCASPARSSSDLDASDDSLSVDPSLTIQAPKPMPFDTIDVKYLLGQFDPAKDTNFERIPNQYSGGNARGTYLRKETLEAFGRMHAAAKADGVTLTIISSTRNFWRQKAIWEAKWTGARKVGGKNLSVSTPDPTQRAKTILLYSSMPGTSRHHWGTDIDINNLTNSYFASGKGLKEYQWLTAHGHEYGFCQPYTPKGEDRSSGYEEEKWHWSYAPLGKDYLASYQELVNLDMIEGFKGSEAARPLDVISNYVFGISQRCLD